METMGEAMVTVMRCESDETRARLAATLHRDGMRPVLVHCATSASADAVVSLLALRPNAPTVRRSPDAESVADFKAAIAAAPDTIHVYYEQVCDVCGALPPLFHTSVRAGFFCRPCAEAIICGGDTKIAGRVTVPNDTQTIDADALRARLAEMAQRARDEMTPAGLRERIAAALRARHGDGVTVEFFARGNAVARVRYSVPGLHCVTSVFCHDENDGGALGALAYACGLNVDGTDPRDQGEALARRLHAERESVVAELDRVRDETDELHALVSRQATIMTGVANALRGDPGPLASHSHHDLAERAAAAVAEVARLRALLEVAQTSLAAATSGRRVTACDEIERLQRERDALRDAAREYLDARHRGLVELLAYLDADPADAAARDAVSADEARVTATRTRLAALVEGAR